jgi:hypothetical protein
MSKGQRIHKNERIHHLTLNTGHVARTRRGEVDDEVIELLRPIVDEGEGNLTIPGGAFVDIFRPLDAQRVPRDGAAAFQVAKDGPMSKLPWVFATTCWREELAEEAWDQHRVMHDALYGGRAPTDRMLWAMYQGKQKELPERPAHLPWLVVSIGPAGYALEPVVLPVLGDFERCLAWAIIEEGVDLPTT